MPPQYFLLVYSESRYFLLTNPVYLIEIRGLFLEIQSFLGKFLLKFPSQRNFKNFETDVCFTKIIMR